MKLIWRASDNRWVGHYMPKLGSSEEAFLASRPGMSLVAIPEGLPRSIAGLQAAGYTPNPATGLPVLA